MQYRKMVKSLPLKINPALATWTKLINHSPFPTITHEKTEVLSSFSLVGFVGTTTSGAHFPPTAQ